MKKIEMIEGTLSLTTIYTETDIYFLATLPHGPPNVINFNISDKHDYFGIEFYINNDGCIMGTPWSPDDMFLVEYKEKGALELFAHTWKVYEDAPNGGVNDVKS